MFNPIPKYVSAKYVNTNVSRLKVLGPQAVFAQEKKSLRARRYCKRAEKQIRGTVNLLQPVPSQAVSKSHVAREPQPVPKPQPVRKPHLMRKVLPFSAPWVALALGAFILACCLDLVIGAWAGYVVIKTALRITGSSQLVFGSVAGAAVGACLALVAMRSTWRDGWSLHVLRKAILQGAAVGILGRIIGIGCDHLSQLHSFSPKVQAIVAIAMPNKSLPQEAIGAAPVLHPVQAASVTEDRWLQQQAELTAAQALPKESSGL